MKLASLLALIAISSVHAAESVKLTTIESVTSYGTVVTDSNEEFSIANLSAADGQILEMASFDQTAVVLTLKNDEVVSVAHDPEERELRRESRQNERAARKSERESRRYSRENNREALRGDRENSREARRNNREALRGDRESSREARRNHREAARNDRQAMREDRRGF